MTQEDALAILSIIRGNEDEDHIINELAKRYTDLSWWVLAYGACTTCGEALQTHFPTSPGLCYKCSPVLPMTTVREFQKELLYQMQEVLKRHAVEQIFENDALLTHLRKP